MKANVKFWPESRSLDVSLYAENELELTQLRGFEEQAARVGGINPRTNRPTYTPLPFHFSVKVPASQEEMKEHPIGMIWQTLQGRARLADVPLTGAWPKRAL
jgi:hypothetical protein